jgi:hypothetical protein
MLIRKIFRVCGIPLGILFFTLLPLFSVLICEGIASYAGCRVDEGSVHPCMVGGNDIGELLYGMFVMGWMLLLTMPVGMLLLTCWFVFFALKFIRARGKKKGAAAL